LVGDLAGPAEGRGLACQRHARHVETRRHLPWCPAATRWVLAAASSLGGLGVRGLWHDLPFDPAVRSGRICAHGATWRAALICPRTRWPIQGQTTARSRHAVRAVDACGLDACRRRGAESVVDGAGRGIVAQRIRTSGGPAAAGRAMAEPGTRSMSALALRTVFRTVFTGPQLFLCGPVSSTTQTSLPITARTTRA